ncbi:derlin-3 isoform X10 [Camelus dromedarius]|uniref:derlin-3 isoform X10 n=1 Tax=Camelus dromedarius TaxID=9838 RepID=UPI0031199FF3
MGLLAWIHTHSRFSRWHCLWFSEGRTARAARQPRFNGVAGAGDRVPAGASGDADLHRGLRPHHRRRAAGAPQPLPTLLQPAPRVPEVPGTIPALGAHGLLNAAGQLHPCGPAGDRCGPHLLLPGGCLPQPARRQEAAADPRLPEAATGHPRGGPQLPAPPGGAATTPAAVTPPRARASPGDLFSQPWAGLQPLTPACSTATCHGG